MVYHSLVGQRLIALFLLGWLLFNQPLLGLFSGAGTLFGVPSIYAYVFVAWTLLIGLLALVVERKSPDKENAADVPD